MAATKQRLQQSWGFPTGTYGQMPGLSNAIINIAVVVARHCWTGCLQHVSKVLL